MSGFFGDALDFEMFNLKDLWKGLRKDPKRLILGVDPWSTKAWNFVLNRDDEPLVDQMGGPYDGSVLSLGEKGKNGERGGVYGRYEAQGGDAGAAKTMHNIAHVIAALFGAQGLAGIGGGGGAGASGGGTSAYGPYANGYQWAPGSEYGASTGFGSLGGLGGGGSGAGVTAGGYSAYGPYSAGYQFPGGTDFSSAPQGAGTPTNPYQSRSMPQQQQEQQQPAEQNKQRLSQIADMIANQQAGGQNNPLWNAPPAMSTPPAAMQDPYAKMREALLKQKLETEAMGFGLWDKPNG